MKIFTYVLAVAAIVFLILWLQQCGRSKESELLKQANESRYISKLAIADKEIARRNAFLSAQDSARRKSEVQHTKTQDSLKSLIYGLKSKIIKTGRLKTITDTLICTPLVAQLLKRDSVISLDSVLVADLEQQRDSAKSSYETSLDSLGANLETMKGKFKLADEARDSLKNLKPDSNWGLGLTGGVGAVVSDGVVRAGPGVSFGVSYHIPIKINIRKLFRKRK